MDNVLTVSALTESIRDLLNGQYANIWVSGEISGLSQPRSGHVYLTLKDEFAQLSAVVWRSNAHQLQFIPENGVEVICRGYIDVYAQRGSYQLNIQQMQPLGIGALQLAFRQLHDRLKQEGLFDQQHKQPLPRIPQRVAVVTSPTGAAIQDFLQVIRRRWPLLDVLVVPVQVQGSASSADIAAAIKRCGSRRFPCKPDVVVVTRGGGSLEDLWSFNEEAVVRAIHKCPIPVVSAVGHEVDVTLSDLVADVRALTPTEAGEILVPDQAELRRQLASNGIRMRQLVSGNVGNLRQRLRLTSDRAALRKPLTSIRQFGQQLDSFDGRMSRVVDDRCRRARLMLDSRLASLRLSSKQLIPHAKVELARRIAGTALARPLESVHAKRDETERLGQRLIRLAERAIEQQRQRLEIAEQNLAGFDPQALLKRGYSITVDEAGRPVVSCRDVSPGDTIQSILADGKITSRIESLDESPGIPDGEEKED